MDHYKNINILTIIKKTLKLWYYEFGTQQEHYKSCCLNVKHILVNYDTEFVLHERKSGIKCIIFKIFILLKIQKEVISII